MFAATRAAVARTASSTSSSPSSSSAIRRTAQINRHFSSSSPTKNTPDVYILGASRTPTAAFNGSFTSVPAPELGATAIKSALTKSALSPTHISEVYMGNVLQANIGQSPARQASILAGLPTSVDATTINKVCASGLKSVALAAQSIQLGVCGANVAGGMENMTRVPYYLSRASQMPGFGDVKVRDGLVGDGLWDVYNQIHMGNCAEETARKFGISREEQDGYAIESYRRAQEAWAAGWFEEEVVPVTVKMKKGKEVVVSRDEGFDGLKLEKIPTLKPAFVRDGTGTVTAANSSTLNDGASAVVLGNREVAIESLKAQQQQQQQQQQKQSKPVIAKILSSADAATAPIDFPTAPSLAVPLALERAGVSVGDVAVWEFNEAFAAVIRANAKILGLDGEADSKKVNPRGGAISLGHALGSSGSRILVTLLHELQVGEIGVAAICNGGGAATAMVVKRVEGVE